ncbi:MAG: asparagine synthetase B family protein [Azonexus sp.]
MTLTPSPLVLGKPRFLATDLQQLAEEHGALRAWQKAYECHGVSAPNSIAGDFAIAMQTTDGAVFMAVDRFAIRSLCYREVNGQLRFAERADELADASTDIDEQAIFNYFYSHVIPSPRTIFKGVYRLPPGHYALYASGRLTVAPYWTPTFIEPGEVSFEELREEFRSLLKQAVTRQLDGGKAGCFLSGGTDSSTVAGMIGLACGTRAATYSIGFEAEGYDEMAFARIAARHFDTEHHEYYVTPDDLVRSIPLVAASYDQPFGNSSALPAYYCAKMAKEDGLFTILAGDGGDELFGGNSRYAKQRIFNAYRHLPGIFRKGIMEPLFKLPGMDRIPVVKKGCSYIEQASLPMPDRLQLYNLITRLGIDQVLTPEFLRVVNQNVPLELQRAVWDSAVTDNLTNRELAFDWRFTLAESDLPKVCGTTRLAGLNVGFPMLDDELLAFSMRLPADYKLNGLKLRWFFKEALRGFLPEEIIVKKKQGFGLPFGVWLTRHQALRKLARESVEGLVRRGVLHGPFVEQLFNEHLPQHPGYYGEMIWISMMLEQWLRKHRDGYAIKGLN